MENVTAMTVSQIREDAVKRRATIKKKGYYKKTERGQEIVLAPEVNEMVGRFVRLLQPMECLKRDFSAQMMRDSFERVPELRKKAKEEGSLSLTDEGYLKVVLPSAVDGQDISGSVIVQLIQLALRVFGVDIDDGLMEIITRLIELFFNKGDE